MRGEIQHTRSVQQAMAVLDLVLGGVKAEMADTAFDWLAVPEKKVAAPVVVVNEGVLREIPVVLPKASASDALRAPTVEPKKIATPKAEAPGEVWVEGAAGGVVLVVQGGMPGSGAQALAKAMLAAVGLQEIALAWVGYTGGITTNALLTAMRAQTPQQVLVLGQAPLGVLLGRNLGVEGWHAAGGGAIAGWTEAPVGVTYPLELLMKQPLFKRLAWQHLRSWGETKTIKIQETTEGDGAL